MQGGIALTSPPCIKKTDQRSNGKVPVCLSNELRNGCRKDGVIKIKKPNDKCDTDCTQRNARTRFVYYARVSGRKAPFATPGWSDTKDRKENGQKPT